MRQQSWVEKVDKKETNIRGKWKGKKKINQKKNVKK